MVLYPLPNTILDNVSSHKCSIIKLDCKNYHDLIKVFKKYAVKQKSAFDPMVHPWTIDCNKEIVMYVAVSLPDNENTARKRIDSNDYLYDICGWMTVKVTKENSQKTAYVLELATKTFSDSTYGGIGSALLKTLEEESKKNKTDFVYLYSLPQAEKFYEKMKYQKSNIKSSYMYKTIHDKGEPNSENRKTLNKVINVDPEDIYDTIFEEIEEKLEDFEDFDMRKYKNLLKNKDFKDEVYSIYTAIELDDEDPDERAEQAAELIKEMIDTDYSAKKSGGASKATKKTNKTKTAKSMKTNKKHVKNNNKYKNINIQYIYTNELPTLPFEDLDTPDEVPEVQINTSDNSSILYPGVNTNKITNKSKKQLNKK